MRIDTEHTWAPRRKSWYDHGSKLVESKIPAILVGFYQRAHDIKADRAEAERRQRQWEEEKRQRKERQERREAHAKLIADLERQAGAWHRARLLRRYIRAARRTLGDQRLHMPFREQSIDFLDWADAYVDQLDPLSTVSHNPDQMPVPSSYPSADESGLKRFLCRLAGFDGLPIPKLTTADGVTGTESDDDDLEECECD